MIATTKPSTPRRKVVGEGAGSRDGARVRIRRPEAVLPPLQPPGRRSRVNLGMLKMMHPDPDGYVAFGRKVPAADSPNGRPVWENLASVRVRDLDKRLPEFLHKLRVDAYSTVNTMKPPRGRHLRGSEMVRSLVAHYVDLDCYKRDYTPDQAYALLSILVASKAVPWPSVVARSGRGLYAFWCFSEPFPYTREAAAQYGEVQRRLQQILDRIGADPAAVDAVRVLRVPGSQHSCGARVLYTPTLKADGTLVTFDPGELARALAVPTVDLKGKARRLVEHIDDPPVAQVPRRRRRPLTLLGLTVPRAVAPQHYVPVARIYDLCHLAEARGGIAEGIRHLYLWRYAQCLLQLGVQGGVLLKWIHDINRRACTPPQPPREVKNALQHPHRWARPKGEFRNTRSDTIARELGVTAKEARALQLRSIMPTSERRRRERARQALHEQRTAWRAEQRRVLAARVRRAKREGRLPSLAELAVLVRRVSGHAISVVTVLRWLRSLGFKTNPHGGARSKRTGERVRMVLKTRHPPVTRIRILSPLLGHHTHTAPIRSRVQLGDPRTMKAK